MILLPESYKTLHGRIAGFSGRALLSSSHHSVRGTVWSQRMLSFCCRLQRGGPEPDLPRAPLPCRERLLRFHGHSSECGLTSLSIVSWDDSPFRTLISRST